MRHLYSGNTLLYGVDVTLFLRVQVASNMETDVKGCTPSRRRRHHLGSCRLRCPGLAARDIHAKAEGKP